MLLAVGNPTVDYMSLDIEGAEYGVFNIFFEAAQYLLLANNFASIIEPFFYRL